MSRWLRCTTRRSKVVHPEGAREARGVLGPGRVLRCRLRVEHRVVDHQLSAPVEKLIERFFALGPLEHIVVVNPLPRQVAPRLAQLVAERRELLLLDEVPLARLDPFLVRNDLVLHALYPPTAESTKRNQRLQYSWRRGPPCDREGSRHRGSARGRVGGRDRPRADPAVVRRRGRGRAAGRWQWASAVQERRFLSAAGRGAGTAAPLRVSLGATGGLARSRG